MNSATSALDGMEEARAYTLGVNSQRKRRMRPTALRKLPLIVLCAVALGTAICCNAQTTPTAVALAASAKSPAANLTQPEELLWSAVGATA